MDSLKINYQSYFESGPNLFVALNPQFEVIAVSDAYLAATMTKREYIIGKNICEVFPPNPKFPNMSGRKKLKECLENVLKTKRPERMAIERYDIKQPPYDGGEFQERFWSPLITPILNASEEVECIISQVEDVTYNLELQREITERSRVELWLDSILNASGEGIFGLDSNGIVTFINQSALKMIGRSREEMIGKNMHYQIHHTKPDGSHYLREECPIQAAFKDGLVHRVDTEIFWRKDGTAFPAEYFSTPLFENHKLVGAVVTFNDITERKRAGERALQLKIEENARKEAEASRVKSEIQEKKLFIILESITDAFFAIDREWRFTYINAEAEKAFLKLGGRDPDPIGKLFLEFMPEIKNTLFEIEYRRAMLEQRAVHFEEYFPPLQAWLNVHAYPSSEGLSVYFRNVTEQKRNEVRLKMMESVVTTANDAVLITESYPLDRPGPAIIYVNEAFTRMTGWSAEEVIGLEPRFLQGPKTDRKLTRKIRKALEDKTAIKVELLNYKKDKTEFFVEISIVPVFDNQGKLIYFTSVQRDTTDRRQAEATALSLVREEAALRESQQATKIRDEVLQVVAHDLRNPINAITLGADMLIKRAPKGQDNRKEPEIIKRSAERASRLIEDLLDVAKMQAKSLTVKKQPLDTGAFLKDTLDLQISLIENKDLGFIRDIPVDLPDIYADRDRLQQVLSNLIGNAIKFTPGGGTISIAAKVVNDEIHFSIADSGPGIPEDQITHIFDPFWQATLGTREGAGLGLAISKGIVEAHGGKIWVESKVGIGTNFSFSIPMVDASEWQHGAGYPEELSSNLFHH